MALLRVKDSSLPSNLLLDSTNYVEHYGLVRKQLNADKPYKEPIYEAAGRNLSWDLHNAFSNAVLFKV